MTCYHPLDAWRNDAPSRADNRLIFTYHPSLGRGPDLKVPCGQCVGCRLERSRQWAVRCVHEASLHTDNCFITLTYNDEHLPSDGSLNYRDFQLFMKRLRKRVSVPVRFYMCGEYGENFGRPHFHACLFGFNFPDLKLWKSGKSKLYRSPLLEELWPFGYSSVGDVNFESAAYVARYILKKVTGADAAAHYDFRRSFNRGDIKPPPRVYADEFEARHRSGLV